VKDQPLLVDVDPQSLRAESFRQLRTNIQFLDVDDPIKVVVVTSAVAEEGKSVTSANLALAMMATSARVLIIEADLRRPVQSDFFGVERAAGLTDVIAGRVDLDDVLQPWGTDGLAILPSGHLPPDPSELLGSAAMSKLLGRLRERFDFIVIDTPPLLPVTDAAVLATQADGVVLVVRYGKTSRHQVSSALRSIRAVGARFLGTVLTMAPSSRSGTYTYYPSSAPVSNGDAPVWNGASVTDRGDGPGDGGRRPVESAKSRRAT
jgi:succinoglycan biosynthesis transport protein ExoP